MKFRSIFTVKMWIKATYFIIICLNFRVSALWEAEINCPMVCTCRLEHLSDTIIQRFTQNHKNHLLTDSDNHVNNEVLIDEDFDSNYLDDNPLLRSITCILQTETNVVDLLEKLPQDTNSLTIIQGAESGNKTIKFSDLKKFSQLIILELQGTKLNDHKLSNFFCDIDSSLGEIKYLNLDKVFIKTESKEFTKLQGVENQEEEVVTFEFTQQLNPRMRPLTLLQKASKREVLPYNKYLEDSEHEMPLFLGFHTLILLRISSCDLNNINWEMFEGLQNLRHLILERNKLMYIPDFAFYGTPNLQSLSLAHNNLLNIQITDLAGLLELQYLDLSHNNFSQLSELSFPPFPKLKLANFKNNPIDVVFPNTFEVMNTTDSLILGGEETPLTLIKNSFLGLKMLKKLVLHNLVVPKLHSELLVGMPNLSQLIMTGNISKLQFDAFSDVYKLEKLIISNCNLQNISMDTFMGLEKLQILDLSQNNLEFLPPGAFDPLTHLQELYLNDNKFVQLPREIFMQIRPKLIRLNNNPWHCSCKMSDWKPTMINKIKQKTLKTCKYTHDKGVGCHSEIGVETKFVFDTNIAPTCTTPKKYLNWNVFHVMRKKLRCTDYKPKIKKKTSIKVTTNQPTDNLSKMEKLQRKIEFHQKRVKSNQDVPVKISLFPSDLSNDQDNNLNSLHSDWINKNDLGHLKKIKKHKKKNDSKMVS